MHSLLYKWHSTIYCQLVHISGIRAKTKCICSTIKGQSVNMTRQFMASVRRPNHTICDSNIRASVVHKSAENRLIFLLMLVSGSLSAYFMFHKGQYFFCPKIGPHLHAVNPIKMNRYMKRSVL